MYVWKNIERMWVAGVDKKLYGFQGITGWQKKKAKKTVFGLKSVKNNVIC